MRIHQRTLSNSKGPRRNRVDRHLLAWFPITLVVLASFVGKAQSTNPPVLAPKPLIIPSANRLPDANDQMEMREQQGKQQDFATANVERRKQIASDSTKLLKLATDLKTEVDKTTKDTLSINVIRKADEIERLAHSVKEKMKLTVGQG